MKQVITPDGTVIQNGVSRLAGADPCRPELARIRRFGVLPPRLSQGLVEALADAAAELWPEAPPLLEDLDDARLKRVAERALESRP